MTKIKIDQYYNRPRRVPVRVEMGYIETPIGPYRGSKYPHMRILSWLSLAILVLTLIVLVVVSNQTVECDEIIVAENHYTGKLDTVCEVVLKSE